MIRKMTVYGNAFAPFELLECFRENPSYFQLQISILEYRHLSTTNTNFYSNLLHNMYHLELPL